MAENSKKSSDTIEAEAKETKTSKKKLGEKISKEEFEKIKLQLEETNDKFLRLAAEYDNFKRRTEKEKIAAAEFTSAQLLKKLLPVFDNVDRASAADKDSADYAKGVEMIVKILSDSVHELGLVEIGAEGESFNPSFHEAVIHIDDENLGENVICKVLQKGYKIGDTVIRPAMVQVAN